MSDPRAEWGFLGRRLLVVSRFPPAQDGIARYAGQLDLVLREGRELVELGIPFGGGDRVRALWGGMRPLRIILHAGRAREVLVHYHPHYFIRGRWGNRLLSYAALAIVARTLRTAWIVHEPDDPRPDEIGRRGRLQFAVEERLRRAFWAGADALVFHSETERAAFTRRFPGRRAERVHAHGAFFVPETRESRGEARAALGVAADRKLVLLIGFLSPHKGYERAIAAFSEANLDDADLHIVGSPIRPTPEVERHVAELREHAARTPRLFLHERFVSDEDFDRWVRAADVLLTPYHSAASSGVMARAQMLGTPVITSAAGGLAEQAGPADRAFGTQAELVAALRQVGRSS